MEEPLAYKIQEEIAYIHKGQAREMGSFYYSEGGSQAPEQSSS